jgi:hypothetical protein
MHTHTHTYTYTYTFACIHTQESYYTCVLPNDVVKQLCPHSCLMHTHTHTYTYTYTYTYIHRRVSIPVFFQTILPSLCLMHTHTHTHTYTYTYTYIHTQESYPFIRDSIYNRPVELYPQTTLISSVQGTWTSYIHTYIHTQESYSFIRDSSPQPTCGTLSTDNAHQLCARHMDVIYQAILWSCKSCEEVVLYIHIRTHISSTFVVFFTCLKIYQNCPGDMDIIHQVLPWSCNIVKWCHLWWFIV